MQRREAAACPLPVLLDAAYRALLRTQRPAPPHDGAPSLGGLPLDLVRLILAHLPQRPRLLVAALVCRRWAAVARELLTAIDLGPHATDQRTFFPALLLLPTVTRLRGLPPEPPLVPPNLRAWAPVPHQDPLPDFARYRLTGLTALDLRHLSDAEHFAADSAATLTKLKVSRIYFNARSGQYTALRSLTLVSASSTHYGPLAHLPRLCRLSVDDTELFSRYPGDLSRLTRLAFTDHHHASPAVPMSTLAARLPLLRSLRLTIHSAERLAEVLCGLPALPHLTHFGCSLTFADGDPIGQLQRVSCLRRLGLRTAYSLDLQGFTSLTKLAIQLGALPLMPTQLRVLKFRIEDRDEDFDLTPLQCLTRLRTLRLRAPAAKVPPLLPLLCGPDTPLERLVLDLWDMDERTWMALQDLARLERTVSVEFKNVPDSAREWHPRSYGGSSDEEARSEGDGVEDLEEEEIERLEKRS